MEFLLGEGNSENFVWKNEAMNFFKIQGWIYVFLINKILATK